MATLILSYGMGKLVFVGVFINICHGNIDLNITEKDDGTEPNLHDMEIELLEIISGNVTGTETEECPSSLECLKNCPVGYAKDERGCPDCSKCSTEGLFESDIIVHGEEDLETILDVYGANYDENGQERSKRDAYKSSLYQWPKDGNEVKIPYVVDSNSLGSTLDGYIDSAIADVHDKTCIRFVGREQERDYVNFKYSNTECSSSVGKRGGMQVINLSSRCADGKGVVIHEIMHALGFWHEHSRPDRDDYIEIQWNNVPRDNQNFAKQPPDTWDSFSSSYDIDSVMQYDGYSGAVNQNEPTIINKATSKPVVAQRAGFSTEDVFQVNKKYSCPEMNCSDRLSSCPDYLHRCSTYQDVLAYWCPFTCRLC